MRSLTLTLAEMECLVYYYIREKIVLKIVTYAATLVLIVPLTNQIVAQQPADISAIGDFRVATDNLSAPTRSSRINFSFEELEIAIQGYLNPYARGDIFVSSAGDNFEIEEASATILRGLPWNLNLRAGRYLIDFGRVNQQHPHVLPFLEKPLALRVLLGADGLRDDGVNVNTSIPIGSAYANLSLNILSGRSLAEENVDRGTGKPIVSGRYNIFLPVSEHANLGLGLSGLHGIYFGKDAEKAEGRDLWATMGGFDFKYKLRKSDYNSLTIAGELIFNRRHIISENSRTQINNVGSFAYVNCQFRKRYNAGVLVDYAPGIDPIFQNEIEPPAATASSAQEIRSALDEGNSTLVVSGFFGFALMEETMVIRLLGSRTEFHVSEGECPDREFQLNLQMLFSLGPHKPHVF